MRNKSILITGAASGLGEQLALEARARGYDLYLVDNSPKITDVAAKINAKYLIADLSDRRSLDEIAEWARNAEIIINNAGIAKKEVFHKMSTLDAERVVAVNILAPMILSRIYLERFYKSGSGAIINISSSASYFPTPQMAPYGASKAWLNAFTESLFIEVKSFPKIKILAICPSGMNTDFQQSSGVKRDYSELLLNPVIVAKRIFNDIEKGRSGIRNYGTMTHLFKILRSFLPAKIYLRLIGYLINRYR
ncbi:MAG: Short-chain dehydrogenase/reductase SDR [Parcubacteria group bacterium GW2011_GWD2_38_12]|nr:MAG: Short-chain dehydrogenase/reductase SDR [Parcubacteria group bacterium GW2011_GWC2_36_17]KKQ43032.1 MAG: Short-chain dehydrogenase/reductase SDR [Parcubacteria group bacterium GW2011_GWE2_37_8]KKQ52467.1 MAG: Short-chain dehydrogenase/reductase SDR [Parcubacteria group bacterium GW2011_GWD2_38_12]KKQ58361.1 MAG: Short-chain dehydrogenase/reductase SDR [Parcubacteria group bacterium GW2011_GWC1_38_17]KKQ59494.1 MAG: Short-chain dehydrogenase/reductase SDR [Parcubacteria group bacterium G